ncbi:hypothetical protein NQ317_001043 [Molorchus minor]|uniref:Uncharacterized protein n=1 Tax=Molorchus minor TaxID=1323400 RepID=A0ABQ9IUV9_9CUCU|nr:hypothetical protein NQ317_001043 [Molorchus minor]
MKTQETPSVRGVPDCLLQRQNGEAATPVSRFYFVAGGELNPNIQALSCVFVNVKPWYIKISVCCEYYSIYPHRHLFFELIVGSMNASQKTLMEPGKSSSYYKM